MKSRRNFIKKAATVGIMAGFPGALTAGQYLSGRQNNSPDNLIWSILIHLSRHHGFDHIPEEYNYDFEKIESCDQARMWTHAYRDELSFDEDTWDALLAQMAGQLNMVIIDVQDGVKYESHPEIAVKNAWSADKLRNEVSRLREMGFEPIPKLNFSTTHDAWLGEYGRMVSTKEYYSVCRNLIHELIDIFDTPRFFHLGMDEEHAANQRTMQKLAVIRQNDLWWHDFYFLVGEVEKHNVRPWIWSDYAWNHPEVFFRKMPKSVLQSNWHYDSFEGDLNEELKTRIKLYSQLEEHGYDQVPTGSNHRNPDNFELTVEYCKNLIDPSRLIGFMTAPWRPTLPVCFDSLQEAIFQVITAKNKYYK